LPRNSNISGFYSDSLILKTTYKNPLRLTAVLVLPIKGVGLSDTFLRFEIA